MQTDAERGDTMTVETSEYTLDEAALDRVSEEIGTWLESLGLSGREIVRFRLTMEELLLRVREHGAAARRIRLTKRSSFGRRTLLLRYDGDAFDPTAASGDEWSVDILARLGLAPSWSYHNGVNTIRLCPPKAPGRGQLFQLAVAVALAAALGGLGSFLPAEVREQVILLLLNPLSDAFLGLLGTFAGIMVFLTVASSIVGAGSIGAVNRMARTVFASIVAVVLCVSFATAALAWPFARLRTGAGAGGGDLKSVSEMIFNILPRDPVSPFQTGNIMQILVLAIAVGLVLILLDERGKAVRGLIDDCGTVVNTIMEYVCRLIPVFVLCSLLRQIWSGILWKLMEMWKPVGTYCAVCLALSAIALILTALRTRCSPILLLRKVLPASLIAFSTASSLAAYTTATDTCENRLGINRRLIDFAYPIVNVMYMPAGSVVLNVISIYLAMHYKVATSASWFVECAMLCAILALAAPPVPGSFLMLLAILNDQLGIPSEGMLQAVAMMIVLDFFLGLFDVLLKQLLLVWQADRLRMLNLKVLRRA